MSNLSQRILVAVITIPLIWFITWQGGVLFLLLCIALGALAQWEFYELSRMYPADVHEIAGLIAGFAINIWFYYLHDQGLIGLVTAIIIGIGLWELMGFNPRRGLERYAFTILGIFYAAWLMAHAVLLRELPLIVQQPYGLGTGFIFLAFVPTWIGDTAAYGFGKTLGKHRLSPTISPKKSIEGSIFGLLFTIITVLVMRWVYADYLTFSQALLLGLIIGIVAQLGDLIESLLKRDAGVKDSSHFLPGHGGILDRFDAALFTLPITYYFLRYIVFLG